MTDLVPLPFPNISAVSAAPTASYAELHAHSFYSFLDGVSSPQAMVARAKELGLTALALLDHDGFYGVIQTAQAAKAAGLATVMGTELSLPDEHLVVLARNPEGYRLLSRLIAQANLRSGIKGKPAYDFDILREYAARGHWVILTGCTNGRLYQKVHPLVQAGKAEAAAWAAYETLKQLYQDFSGQIALELSRFGFPSDDEMHDAFMQGLRLLCEDGLALEIPVVATTNAHQALATDKQLADVCAALNLNSSLAEAAAVLPQANRCLRSASEMLRLFPRYPSAVQAAADLAASCAFDISIIAPNLPPFPVPNGHTEASFLRQLVYEKAPRLYGYLRDNPVAYARIEKELQVITELNFPGYFLIVHDIVDFCAREGILCQGRGSAANSVVCFVLGITNADPVRHGLLFERFLSVERDGPPDIDVDIASDRRDEVIAYVFQAYGREYAAQVATVITYRSRMAVRDAAKVLGFSATEQNDFTRLMERGSKQALEQAQLPEQVLQIAHRLHHAPRHTGIHSGGMVLCDRPVIDVCPVQWARREGRTVLQWDKEDCADAGLVKFDLLGLGMLTAISHAFTLIAQHHGEELTLPRLPQEDPQVYDMLCAGDAVGVFQVESRAQIAMLPRLKPREFYDLVMQVAIVRPGPIQGGSVHPFIRRRCGLEPVSYLDPILQPCLKRTLGVPLFQEQLMQMVMDTAGFDAQQADRLRRAMGWKRSRQAMEALRDDLFSGMAQRGIKGTRADRIYQHLQGFAHYGFPESHAFSFAYLVYASAFLKRHYPAAFCAALLRSQPMGFYSPQSLVADVRRHGVKVLGVDINRSAAQADLEFPTGHTPYQATIPAEVGPHQLTGIFSLEQFHERFVNGPALRLGLASVKGISTEVADAIVLERSVNGPFTSIQNLASRVALSRSQLEALATAKAFSAFHDSYTEALWQAGAVALHKPGMLPVFLDTDRGLVLPPVSDLQDVAAEVWATGISTDQHPLTLYRSSLNERGVFSLAALRTLPDGMRVEVAGFITHRQRPATATGITFLNLEDETGMLNVVCSKGFWAAHRHLLLSSRAVIIRGLVQNTGEVVALRADGVANFAVAVASRARDFC